MSKLLSKPISINSLGTKRAGQVNLNIAHLQAETGAYTETGGARSALTGNASSTGATWSVTGLRARFNSFDLGGGLTLAPKVDVGWQHGFDRFLPQQSQAFVSTGTAFTVFGAPLDRDAAVTSLGASFGFAGGDLSFSYDGLYSGRATSNIARIQLNLAL